MKSPIKFDALDGSKYPLAPLSLITTHRTGWTPPSGQKQYYGGGVKWANISDLGCRFVSETTETITDKAVLDRGLPTPSSPGDLLFSFKLSVGTVSIARSEMFTNEAIATFSPSDKLDVRFAYYAFPVFLPANGRINIYGAPLLNTSIINRARIPFLSIEEQQRIADYLDVETGQIDTTVSTLDDLIEEMLQRRGELIQESISSSDSYVGLWEFAEINPSSPGFKTIPDGETVPFLPLENVWSGRSAIYSETKEYKKSDTSYTKFQQGDILVPKVTPTVLHGRSMIAEIPDELGLASSEVHVVRAKDNADPRWITYNLLSRKFLDEARGNVYGVGGLQRISDLYLTHYKVAFESIENQTKIADFLDIETAKIDRIISTATELRSELLARRSALITEVVTGQRQV